MNSYWPGAAVRLSAIFTVGGTATDPTTVTLQTRDPSGTTTAVTVVKDSTGHYHGDVEVAVSGQWHYRWVGAGAAVAAAEGTFMVRGSSF